MKKRFMSDSFMKGAESLLEERFPTDAEVFDGIRTESVPNVRERIHGNNTVIDSPNPFSPEVMVLTNGRMTVSLTDCGTGVSLYNGIDITVNSNDNFNYPQGIFGVFAGEKEVIPFVRALDKGSSTHYKAEFFKNKAEHTAKSGDVLLKMQTTLLKRYDCELRTFTIENLNRKSQLCGKLILYLEPCIEKREEYSSDPMHSKLFLIDEWDAENQCFLFNRRSSAGKNEYSMAVGLLDNSETMHESSRKRVLKPPHGIFSLGKTTDFEGNRGNPDCCGAISTDIKLDAGKKASFTLAVVMGESEEQALDMLLTVRGGKGKNKFGENPFYSAIPENTFASKILSETAKHGLGKVISGENCIYEKSDLQSFGISGEYPIIVAEIKNAENIDEAIPFIRANKKLRNCGIRTDLAIVFDGEDKHTLPTTNLLKSIVEKEHCGLMIGVSGGIHFVNSDVHSYREMVALKKSAVFYTKAGENAKTAPKLMFKPAKFIDEAENEISSKKSLLVKYHDFTNSKISVKKIGETLDIPWTMAFANKSFGTTVSDKAFGFTWAVNSSENKLTSWRNDLMNESRGEMLIMKNNGVLYDLISLSEVEFTPYSAVWRCEVCGIDFCVEVTVAEKGMAKKCTVEAKNKSDSVRNFDLMYYALPAMGAIKNGCITAYAKARECGVTAENPFATIPGFFYLGCNGKADYICLSQKSFYEGKFNCCENGIYDAFCMSVGKQLSLKQGEFIKSEFYLSFGESEESAVSMPKTADFS